ncbi:MAG: putative selenium-dependent hydroxylase accessory protein YqeC [Leptolinea sp.]|nr:putative selenium-dependent hydroxylase accessory protein YqeC [Leptolinea sp.]
MNLVQALRINSESKVSLVGAGGKTSALTRLSLEWASDSLVATTTHLGLNQLSPFPVHKIWLPGKPVDEKLSVTTVITGGDSDGRLIGGISQDLWPDLEKAAVNSSMPLFIESDGSKQRSIKAPASHEPAIPPWVNQVVVCVGLSVVGSPMNEETVHRPEVFSKLTGLAFGEPITLNAIERMLVHSMGGLKNIPENARRTVLLNQIDVLTDRTGIHSIEKQLLKKFDAVVTASLKNADEKDFNTEVFRMNERIAGIILAAGRSHRMGSPKALLDWRGVPFVRACVLTAISSGLDPVYVIVGEDGDRISEVIRDLPVEVVENDKWYDGQSTSIKVGITHLPPWIGGAVFLLVDQPQIPVPLIRKLLAEHSSTLGSIIYPISGGRRANPVLFDRTTFSALLKIQGDVGGRAIFSKFPLYSIPWFDESILIDVDTPEDYQRLIKHP